MVEVKVWMEALLSGTFLLETAFKDLFHVIQHSVLKASEPRVARNGSIHGSFVSLIEHDASTESISNICRS